MLTDLIRNGLIADRTAVYEVSALLAPIDARFRRKIATLLAELQIADELETTEKN